MVTIDRRSCPSADTTSMSNPLDGTTLNASRRPSNDQAGFRPLIGCARRVASSPVSGSTASSCGEPLRVVANPIREPSG